MMTDNWHEFATYPDMASAEMIAGLLRSENIPVCIASDQPIPGLAVEFKIMIPPDLMYRVQWILFQTQFSDEELASIAMDTKNGNDAEQPS